MSNALVWLNDLFQWLGRWIPRLTLIHPTHQGVKFGPRGRTQKVGPGLVVYWPMTHDLIQIPITTQSIQLPGQILWEESSRDSGVAVFPRSLVCVLNLQFSVSDPVIAATRVLHFHALLQNRATALAAIAWRDRDPSAIDWLAQAKDQLKSEMEQYGLAIQNFEIAGMSMGVTIKNFYDYSWNDEANGKRPV